MNALAAIAATLALGSLGTQSNYDYELPEMNYQSHASTTTGKGGINSLSRFKQQKQFKKYSRRKK